MLEYEIESFGKKIGMSGLAFSSDGIIRLDMEKEGSLFLEVQDAAKGRELLVYLARAVPDYDEGAAARLLEACARGKRHLMPVSAGLHDGRAVVLARFAEDDVTAALVDRAVRYLLEFMNKALKA